MAWGYWTAYTTSYANQNRRQRTLSPPNKRDRSLERERDRISLAATAPTPDCVSRTSVTYVSGSGGTGSGRDNDGGIMASAVRNHPGIGKHISSHPIQANHVEPEKVAYERRLLLGDPDWGNRTLADRNTLPRKKQHEYDKSSGSEALYSGGEESSEQPAGVGGFRPGAGGAHASSRSGMDDCMLDEDMRNSPPTTPLDSGSHKSDEIFCPACAHQSSQAASSSRGDINSNRDSRVSFGSVASSSRGSRGSGSGRGGGSGIGNQHRGMQPLGAGGIIGREAIPVTIPPPPHASSSSSTHHHVSMRARSRSQDDDDRCSSRDGLSSSLPTPPPPPTYSSHRDILSSSNNPCDPDDERMAASSQLASQGRAAVLMESMNKKMSFLSKFKSPPQSQDQPYSASSRATHTPNQYQQDGRSSSHKYHTMNPSTGDGRGRDTRNYYQHSNSFVGAPVSHGYRQHYEDNSPQPASILVQAATAAALNHYPTSTSSNRSMQKSSNTSSIEKAAGSSASRDHSSSSLHSLRGGGNDLGDMQSINSPTLLPTNVTHKPALPPKPPKNMTEVSTSNQYCGEGDVGRNRHFRHLAADNPTGTVERRRNHQQSYYNQEHENQGNSHPSHNYNHQRSYSTGRRSAAHSNSRSGSRTPRGSSSRTSRESLDHNKRSRESLSNSRDRPSMVTSHGETKYSRIRVRRGSKEPLEDVDADGDEESEGGNTNTLSVRNGTRSNKHSLPIAHSDHRVRVSQHRQPSSSPHTGRGGSTSSHGRSSRESGSIIGIRNRKSSSVDEMTCGDAMIHRGEYEDDVISTNSSSGKRRKSHGGAFVTTASEGKERVSNDGDNENDVEDEEDEEDEDNRGTMRRRRIRTTSASDHSEVSGTRPSAPYNPTDLKGNARDRLSSGERGDADDDDDDSPNQKKDRNANKSIIVSSSQDVPHNSRNRSHRSSQSQTPEDSNDVGDSDNNIIHKTDKMGNVSDKEQYSDASKDTIKSSLAKDPTLSISLSECEEHRSEYNAATMKRNTRKGSFSNSKNGHGSQMQQDISGIQNERGIDGKQKSPNTIPCTTSPPSLSIIGNNDQDIHNNPFSFGRPSLPSSSQTSRPVATKQSTENNSRTNVQYFKHYDHREQFPDPTPTIANLDSQQHPTSISRRSDQQPPIDFRSITSTTPATRRDFLQHTSRRAGDKHLTADHRRKSASIGDRLSDVDNIEENYNMSRRNVSGNQSRSRGNSNQQRPTHREDSGGYRKSHTLDDRHSRRGQHDFHDRGCTLPNQPLRQPTHNHQISSVGSFQNIMRPNSGAAYTTSSGGFAGTKKFFHQQPSGNSSTKSEKSSSRSSQSPSIDGNKYGNC